LVFHRTVIVLEYYFPNSTDGKALDLIRSLIILIVPIE
jgi:hypothetical protein